ncbi:MAG: DUF2971 domain-containing protein [Bacteroidaceae bacterium]|nr:DUF2971 domain-containing protein [Bacteroidaceae bacterium]
MSNFEEVSIIMALPHKKQYNHMVYKYYPFNNYTKDALFKSYLFFSKASRLNDPYDTSSMLLSDEFYEKLTSVYYKEGLTKQNQIEELKRIFNVMDDYGTCSFSKYRDNMHLWALYANSFSGIVIGFDEKKLNDLFQHNITRLMNVDYVEQWPPSFETDSFKRSFWVQQGDKSYKFRECFEGDHADQVMDYFFQYLCTVKGESWKEEQEVRLVAPNGFIKKLKNGKLSGVKGSAAGYNVPFLEDAVKEIIVGHNFNGKPKIIKKLAKKYGIKKIQTTSCTTPFKIDIVRHDELTNYVNR